MEGCGICETAVAQVVLNRVRHPAYPKSICGVVYQGAARPFEPQHLVEREMAALHGHDRVEVIDAAVLVRILRRGAGLGGV